MIIYLTYNDAPSGVYWSQVTQVVDHLNGMGRDRVRLVAFVSGRGFGATKQRIKQHAPNAWVLPMVPKMRFWRWNLFLFALVCIWFRPSGVMARGVFATWMAQRARSMRLTRKVCFDGRGAYAAEWEEYRLIDDDALIAQFRPLEMAAVQGSDMRLAVSQALVEHWAQRYQWRGPEHVVVPCTLGSGHTIAERGTEPHEGATSSDPKDITLVYSGSTAGWQSFALLSELLDGLLTAQPQVKVLFLSKPDPNNAALQAKFPDRMEVRWAEAHDVGGILARCDMGLLIREDSITNRVASPTKFAEYLAAGLPVLISPWIGDFSQAVEEHGLGEVHRPEGVLPQLRPTDAHTARRMQSYARAHLTKAAFEPAYGRILEALA